MPALRRTDRRGVAFTLRGWGMLATGLIAVVAAPALAVREMLFLGLVLVGLPLGAAVTLLLSPIRLTVQRRFDPRVVSVGDVVAVEVTVRNGGSAVRADLIAQDTLGREGDTESHDVADARFRIPGLARSGLAASSFRARYRQHAGRRGVHRLGPMRVVRGDPLGLVTRETPTGDAQPFVVTPRTVALESDELDSFGVGGVSAAARPSAGPGADDVIPRDYRPGDAMRRVHWRASARSGELKVRQDEQNTDPHSWLLLETRSERFDGFDAEADFEWAVSMTASLSVHLIERGFEAHLLETVAALAEEGPASDEIEFAHDVLLHLARVRPVEHRHETDAPARIIREVREAGDSRPVIAVLGRVTEADFDALTVLAVHARPAIAFVVGEGGTRRSDADALAARGWYAVPTGADTPIDQAWSTALAMRALA